METMGGPAAATKLLTEPARVPGLFPTREQLLVPCASQSSDQRQILDDLSFSGFCGELTLREDREIKAVSACAGAVRASGLGPCMWVCMRVCIRACGLLAGRDLSLPSGFGACGIGQVKFRNQILLLILLFTGTDRFLLLSKLKTLYVSQDVYRLCTYGSGSGLIILESNSLEVLRKIRCANMC